MTREEIITKIKSFCHNCEKFPTCVNTDKECFKALEMAIEALSAEPCEDCISRAEAINAIEEYGSVWMEYTEEMSIHQIAERALKASKQSMYKILHDLPSVQPKDIYNKGWQDGAEATAYHVELCEKENPTIPMSVIEDIKAEIANTVLEESKQCDGDYAFLKWCAGLKYSLKIINKHIEDIGGK